jgi:hypothetical protein
MLGSLVAECTNSFFARPLTHDPPGTSQIFKHTPFGSRVFMADGQRCVKFETNVVRRYGGVSTWGYIPAYLRTWDQE